MKNPALALVLVLLPLCFYAKDKKPPQPATHQQDSRMMGRIFAAIEDDGGGFKDEALRRLESINADLEKLEYSPETRWNAHYLYAKVLREKHDWKKATKMIVLAKEDSQSLGAKEQKETDDLAQQIDSKTK